MFRSPTTARESGSWYFMITRKKTISVHPAEAMRKAPILRRVQWLVGPLIEEIPAPGVFNVARINDRGSVLREN